MNKNYMNYSFERLSSNAAKIVWTIGAFLFAFSVIAFWLISGPHPDFPDGFSDQENKE